MWWTNEEFSAISAFNPDIIHISGDIYAMAYTGQANDGFISTVQITSDGQIGALVIDTLEFDTSTGWKPSMVSTGAGVFAISYRGQGNDGHIATVALE